MSLCTPLDTNMPLFFHCEQWLAWTPLYQTFCGCRGEDCWYTVEELMFSSLLSFSFRFYRLILFSLYLRIYLSTLFLDLCWKTNLASWSSCLIISSPFSLHRRLKISYTLHQGCPWWCEMSLAISQIHPVVSVCSTIEVNRTILSCCPADH